MRKLRIAVCGLGRIGWGFHLPAITGHEGFELKAVADPLPERISEAIEKYGAKGYSDIHDLLAHEKIDMIVVASPTKFHVGHTIAAFEHGLDVFLEKPMVASLEEADMIIGSMKKNGRKLMIYQPERATSEFQAVKSLIGRDMIGKVYMIKHARSYFIRRNDWQSLRSYGGGMLNNYGAHLIDQMLNLAEGSRVNRVQCRMRRIVSIGDAEDVVKAVIEMEDGTLLDMDINMAAAFELPKWYVLGSRGTIMLDGQKNEGGVFRVKYLLDSELSDLSLKSELAADGRLYDNLEKLNWHEELLEVSSVKEINFYDKCYAYFALDEEPFIPVTETREVIRVISECRKDAGW